MIEVDNITKRYGERTAVNQLSFSVKPGEVTGFLGPNGAGKSTTMRAVVGLDRPTSGRATVDGKHYADMVAPLLDARATHPRRRAVDHLRALAATHRLPARRVREVLEQVGLAADGKRRTGGFSLGMRQRLGIAAAMLGDPGTVILDEPVNGLDPEGIIWIRELLSELAAQGRTVFLSSHLMTEMTLVATRVIVIGQGRLIADTSVAELTQAAEITSVTVRTPEPESLASALAAGGVEHTRTHDLFEVRGWGPERIGRLAAERGLVLSELTPHRVSLESAVMKLTEAHRDHREQQRTEAAV